MVAGTGDPSGRTVVAVDDGTIVGTAKSVANHMGPARTSRARASWSTPPTTAAAWAARSGGRPSDWARAEGFRAMQFNAVVESNERAVALWRSLGFEVLGTLPEGFHHPLKGLRRAAHHAPPL